MLLLRVLLLIIVIVCVICAALDGPIGDHYDCLCDQCCFRLSCCKSLRLSG